MHWRSAGVGSQFYHCCWRHGSEPIRNIKTSSSSPDRVHVHLYPHAGGCGTHLGECRAAILIGLCLEPVGELLCFVYWGGGLRANHRTFRRSGLNVHKSQSEHRWGAGVRTTGTHTTQSPRTGTSAALVLSPRSVKCTRLPPKLMARVCRYNVSFCW